MTDRSAVEGLAKLSAETDAELVKRVRAGDLAAYEQIYSRHRQAALRQARRMLDPATAEDVVADAFLALLKRFQAGGGPNFAVRPYLLQVVRFGAIDARRRRREEPVDPGADGRRRSPLDQDVFDVQDQLAENSLAQEALLSLPPRQRTVLWLGEVEGLDRHQIGERLGVSAGAVSALALRARESLKRAYLVLHLDAAPGPECADCLGVLPAVVRGTASRTEHWAVEEHLSTCDSCSRVRDDLAGINSKLSGSLAPATIGLIGAGQIKTVAPGAGSTAPTVGGFSAAFVVAGAAASIALITSVAVALGVLVAPETVHSEAQAQARLALPSAAATRASPPARRPKKELTDSAAPYKAPLVQPTESPTQTPSPSLSTVLPTPLPAPSPQPAPVSLPPTEAESPPAQPLDAASLVTHEDLKLSVTEATVLQAQDGVFVRLAVDLDLGQLSSAVLDIEMAGRTGFSTLSDDEFGPWVCSDQPLEDANLTSLQCVLEPGATTTSLGVDLAFSGQPRGSIAVSAPNNVDPDLTNNSEEWKLNGARMLDQSTDPSPTP